MRDYPFHGEIKICNIGALRFNITLANSTPSYTKHASLGQIKSKFIDPLSKMSDVRYQMPVNVRDCFAWRRPLSVRDKYLNSDVNICSSVNITCTIHNANGKIKEKV